MIKFFRKIRQNLLSEGKTGKYLKYAIGEIILVVIGILIALQINNWNTESENKAKIDNTLKQVQADLLNDIKEITELKKGHQRDFDITRKFLDDSINTSYSKSDYRSLIYATTISRSFSESKQSYINLKAQTASIPEEYNTIVYELNRLYNENFEFLKNAFNGIKSETESYEPMLSRNYDWWEDFINGEMTTEIKKYITSKEHRRHLVISNNNLKIYKNTLGFYQSQSIKCYFIIRDLLKDTSAVPEVIQNLGVLFPNGNIDDYVGTYEGKNLNHRLVKKYNLLFNVFFEEKVAMDGFLLKESAKDSLTWQSDKSVQYVFRRDSLNRIDGFYFYRSNTNFVEISDSYYKKVKDE